jgi:hypothetical protein
MAGPTQPTLACGMLSTALCYNAEPCLDYPSASCGKVGLVFRVNDARYQELSIGGSQRWCPRLGPLLYQFRTGARHSSGFFQPLRPLLFNERTTRDADDVLETAL